MGNEGNDLRRIPGTDIPITYSFLFSSKTIEKNLGMYLHFYDQLITYDYPLFHQAYYNTYASPKPYYNMYVSPNSWNSFRQGLVV
jgi:hypothetical protein